MKNTRQRIIVGMLGLLLLFATHAKAQTGSVCTSAYSGAVNTAGGSTDYRLNLSTGTWISFTATSTKLAFLVSAPTSTTDTTEAHVHSLELYSGVCGNLILIGKDSVVHGSDTLPFLKAVGLTIGNTYFVHVKGFTNTSCIRCSQQSYFSLAIANANKPDITPASTCVACGVNLIVNGDFETAQYPNVTPYQLYGGTTTDMSFITSFSGFTDQYTVSRNSVSPHNSDPNEKVDHTTGTGYFFWGDSRSKWSDGPFGILQDVAWQQNVWVTNGQHYVFSLWIKDIGIYYDIRWSQFKVKIDGQDISGWFNNGSSKTWHQFCFDYTADGTKNVKIEIINKGDYERNGCDFGIDDISFRNVNFNNIASITSNVSGLSCPNQPVTLTAGGGATYVWSTGETTSSIVVTPSVTTVYSVTAYSDVAGCEGNYTTFVVNVAQAPAPLFSTTESGCTNSGVTFTNHTYSYFPATYSWNFGDGNTGNNSTSPVYSYSSPGTYTVTLTSTSACGTNSFSLPVSVIPSTDSYNVNCCSQSQTYTHEGMIRITGSPYTAPTVWSGQHYFVRGTIIIYPGNELYIKNSSVIEFDPLSRIIVLPGGILKVDPNSKLTGLASCGTMWQGIENCGDGTKPQSQIRNPATGELYQGKVILNNATIEMAHNGCVQGRRNNNDASYDPNSGGGILIATNSHFINCGYDVKFVPYTFANISKIQNCDFNCTTLPDPGYNSYNSYTYPNAANALFAYANVSQHTYANVQAIGVRFVKIYDNTLNNAEWGVMGINSNLRVGDGDNSGLGNTFTNITNGETHGNFLSTPFYANQVFKNQYSLQNAPVLVPVQVWAGIGDQITDNNIFSAIVGIGSVTSGAVFINDNKIGTASSSCMIGVSASNSGTMGGLIGFTASGNTFTQCTNSTYLGGSNQFLQVHCNNYINSDANIYARNWYNGGALANQGYLPIIDDKDPAGNYFLQTFPLRNDLYSTIPFDYYAHSADPNGVSVTVIPSPLAASGNVLTNSNMINTGIQETTTSCIPPLPCSNCHQLILQSGSHVSALRLELDSLNGVMDGGQSAYLLNAINTISSAGALETILLANSPLSDEVLLAFISRAGTPPSNFENVLLANSPVSAAVRPALYAAVTGTSIYANIVAAQSRYTNRTPWVVSSELQAAKGDLQQLYNQQQYYYLNQLEEDATMTDSLNMLLAQQNTEASKQALAASFIDQQAYENADNIIKGLNVDNEADAAVHDLLQMLNDLYKSGRDIYSILPAEVAIVRTISTMEKECIARSNAKVLLLVLYGEPLEMQFDFNGTQRQAQPVVTLNTNTSFLGESYPNPATTQVNMQCAVPDGQTAILSIFDMTGKLVYTQTVLSGKQTLTIDTIRWTEGVYMCSLEIDSKRIGLQKMVIVANN